MRAFRIGIGSLFLCILSVFIVVSPAPAGVTFSSQEVQAPSSCQAYSWDNNVDACKACHLIEEPPGGGTTAGPQAFMGLSIFMAASSSSTTTVTSPDGKFTVTYPPTVTAGESFTNTVNVWGYAMTYSYLVDNVYSWGTWPWGWLDRTYTHDHIFDAPASHNFTAKVLYCGSGDPICFITWTRTEISWDVAVGGAACDVSVTGFQADRTAFNTARGESVAFTGGVSSAQPVTWEIAVQSPDRPAGDNVVRHFSGSGAIVDNVAWDGRDDAGQLLPPGEYAAVLTASTGTDCRVSSAVTVSVWHLAIAGFTGGASDLNTAKGGSVAFSGNVTSPGAVTWEVAVQSPSRPAGDNVVRRFPGSGTLVDSVVWDGRDEAGQVVAPGEYAVVLTASAGPGRDDSRIATVFVWDLVINDFRASGTALNTAKEDTIAFDGSVGSSTPVTWEIAVRPAPGETVVRRFSGSGSVLDNIVWDGRDDAGQPVPPGAYGALLTATTGPGLSDSRAAGAAITVWNLSINDFAADNNTLNVAGGDNVILSGAITSSQPVTWGIAIESPYLVPGDNVVWRSAAGTGTIVDNTVWDGWGTVNGFYGAVEPGLYRAVLTAGTAPGFDDSRGVAIDVYSAETCPILAVVESTANVASGNLSHSQDLFSMKGGALPAALSITYNSHNALAGPVGQGWTHSYEISLLSGGGDTYVLREGDGSKTLLLRKGDSYEPLESVYPRLAVGVDGNRIVSRKDGLAYVFDPAGRIVRMADRNGNAVLFAYDPAGALSSITDPAGRTLSFGYDPAGFLARVTDPSGNVYGFSSLFGRLAGITLPDGSTWSYAYDGTGRLSTKADPLGNATAYAYDGRGRLTQATDPEGNSRTIEYHPEAGVSLLTEKDGGVWSYRFDPPGGTLLEKRDPQGQATAFEYDGERNLTRKVDPLGGTATFTHDETGNMLTATDPAGNVTAYTYNALDLVTSVTDPLGRTTVFFYDDRGNLVSSTDPSGATTSSEYDARGNMVRRTDPLGRTSSYVYDPSGNLASITDAQGHTTSFAYDAAGNVVARTDAGGATTSFAYDAMGRLVGVTDPLGRTVSYGYDRNGNRVSATDAEGRTSRYEYDARNRLLRTIDPLGNATTYIYGDTGCSSCGGSGGDRLVAVTDPNGNTTRYEYDLSGRRTREIDPQGKVTTYSYDAIGNVVARTDASGRTTTYLYDVLSRRVGATDPSGGSVGYAYTAAGQLSSVTDPVGVTTGYQYDGSGRLSQVSSPDAGTTTYVYNPDGTLSSKTDGNGTTSFYSYDGAGRLTRIAFPDPSQDITFGYDSPASGNGTGRLTQMADPSGTTVYHYDALGRIAREEKTVLGMTYATSYAYDSVGNLASLTYPSGRVVSYAYDGANRPTSVSSTLGGSTTMLMTGAAYDRAGNRTAVSFGNGLTQGFTYDPGNRIAAIAVPGIEGLAYAYDNTGNILSIADSVNPSASRSFGYDALDRLSWAAGPFGALSWTYDGNGNRLTQSLSGGATTTYAYQGNRLSSVSGATSAAYSYDGAGNTLYDGSREYVYNRNQRLIQVFSAGTELGEYAYDGKGRRVIKKTGPGSIGSATAQNTVYHYDPSGRLLAETAADGKMLAEYVYLGGKPLALIRKQADLEETFFYHDDHLGTPEVMTDKLARPVWNIEFDPFGNEVANKGRRGAYVRNVTNNLRFPGQYYDEETGLHQNFHREYDPRVGRYLATDPTGISHGGNHLFVYSSNNPVNRSDPFGLQDANTWTYGEIRAWAIVSSQNLAAPAGLADAKASIGACCGRGNLCNSVDGSTAAQREDRAAWNNIVAATGGTDSSGGGNYMCVGALGCYITHCYRCCGNQRTFVRRAQNLSTTGTVTVSSTRGGTLYFYNDPLDGWCTPQDRHTGCQ